MKKYYVTCGDIQEVLVAHTPPQAVFLSFNKWLGFVDVLSNVVKVSEIGHEKHPEDELFLLCDMFTLWVLNKNWDGIISQGE